jgi:hypothetical protein
LQLPNLVENLPTHSRSLIILPSRLMAVAVALSGMLLVLAGADTQARDKGPKASSRLAKALPVPDQILDLDCAQSVIRGEVVANLGNGLYEVAIHAYAPHDLVQMKTRAFGSAGQIFQLCVWESTARKRIKLQNGFDDEVTVWTEYTGPARIKTKEEIRAESAYAEVLNSFPALPTPAPTDCTSQYLGGNIWCFQKSVALYLQSDKTSLWAAETFVPAEFREKVKSPSDCFSFFEKMVPGAEAVANIEGGAKEPEYRFYSLKNTLYTAEWRGTRVSDGPCHFVACQAGGRRPVWTSSQVNTWVAKCAIPPHAERSKAVPADDSKKNNPWDR